MKNLFTFLLVVSLFCSGFTWGKTKEGRCKEANELVFNQQKNDFNVLPDGLESKVAELCHDGAAVKFVKGLKCEFGKQIDQAVLNYNSAITIDEHFSDAYITRCNSSQ
ncbi:MAG: hypothetical protein HGB32_03050 [Geobacteraceae bacterium]|nr:hypothetical protein [Geobacteraceae bacterium]NTW79110.1 hypothetical protein [Geobacteraceae bacterium]